VECNGGKRTSGN
jgi:hypothetical protein